MHLILCYAVKIVLLTASKAFVKNRRTNENNIHTHPKKQEELHQNKRKTLIREEIIKAKTIFNKILITREDKKKYSSQNSKKLGLPWWRCG